MHNISLFSFLYGLFITTWIQAQPFDVKNKTVPEFVAPLDIPLYLSSNYGEYRPGHFHAGIDFKTQQVEGKKVLAADSGYVYRIVVLTGSYGNAVYLKHPSGNITLYGHLSRFVPVLDQYVKEQQYKKKSFVVDLTPHSGQFVFRKGELLGLSGNSGGSFGAHLHFEIRDHTGNVPLNPLYFGFDIKDKTSPKIFSLMLYPLSTGALINGYHKNLLIPAILREGTYKIPSDTFKISGKFGIGIETFDYLDNTTNPCGPYSINMDVDNRQIFFCRIDSIPFSSAGYIDSYYDYGENLRTGKKIQKLYVDPNNKLNIYKVAVNHGVMQFDNTGKHDVRISVKDTYGNESLLKFGFVSEPRDSSRLTDEKEPDVVARFSWDSLNVYENKDIRIALPKDALFDDIDFRYAAYDNDSVRFSAIHRVHNRYTPLIRSYVISIKPKGLSTELYDKALIASRGPKGTWLSQGGEFKNGFVTARVRVFGDFIVTVDTFPPVIKPVSFISGGKYSAGQIISFTIEDSISGIRKYTGYIDKSWALFEYDAKNNLLSYAVDSGRLVSGKLHQLEIIVSDNKDNITRFNGSFYF